MSCRTSTALRTTTGLILEFFLRALFGQDRPFKMGGFTPPPGVSAGLNLSLAMIQEDYGAYVAASVGLRSPPHLEQCSRPGRGARARTRRVKGGNGLRRYFGGYG